MTKQPVQIPVWYSDAIQIQDTVVQFSRHCSRSGKKLHKITHEPDPSVQLLHDKLIVWISDHGLKSKHSPARHFLTIQIQ